MADDAREERYGGAAGPTGAIHGTPPEVDVGQFRDAQKAA